MIPNVVQEVEDIEIPPLILGEGAFPLWTFFFSIRVFFHKHS